MEKSKNNLRIFILAVLVGVIIGLLLSVISYFGSVNERGSADVKAIFYSNILRFLVWGILSFIILQLVRKHDFINQKGWFYKILLHIPVGLFFSFLHSIIYAVVTWQVIPAYSERYADFFKYYKEYVFFGDIYMGIIIYPLIIISIDALLFYKNYQEEEAKNSQLKAQLAQSELQALKMQLHPHFLFNTLHSISSLILDDPLKANIMVSKLGNFLRLTLDHSKEQMVTLDEELNFLRSYLEIEQIRFQDRLTVEYQIEPETLTAEVPHLILQPIVENAVKHGIAPHSGAGRINISAKFSGQILDLQIKDNGPGKNGNDDSVDPSRNGKGLFNVRARLEQVYGGDFKMLVNNDLTIGFEVDLSLPARPNENNF